MAASESPVLYSFEKTVATAGTAEVLVAASKRVKSVVIVAKSDNTGRVVYVGGSDVSSSTNGGLGASQSISLEAAGWMDLADIYIDADTNVEGVDFYAVKA